MPRHVDIVDPKIHEPKDISTALLDQVYIADGAGSGAWGTSPGVLSNVVNVDTASDFPTAVANVRTLVDGTLYRVGPAVSIGDDRIVFGTDSRIMGIDRLISSISSSTTGALFTANSVALNISEINIACPNGSLFDYTNGASNPVLLDKVSAVSFLTAGTFANASFGLISTCNFVGGSNQLSFTGTTSLGSFGILNTGFSGYSGIALNLGTAVLNILTLGNNSFSGLGGSTSVSGAAASANINTRGIITSCNFNGAGAAEAGIAVTDLLWERSGNFGLANTKPIMGTNYTGNATVTTIAAANTPVKVNTGGNDASYASNRFSSDTSGTITYNGIEDISIAVSFTIYADVASGTNEVFNWFITKNGTPLTQTTATRSFDSADPGSLTIQGVVALSTTNTIELWTENTTSAINITVITSNGLIE